MIRKPMKGAAVEDLSIVTWPKLGSPKLDGFRCILEQRPLTSRLSRFPNEFFDRNLSSLLPDDTTLDGEVVVGKRRGKGVLGRTSSGLTSRSGEPDFTVWVFDQCSERSLIVPFARRSWEASLIVKELGHPQIKFLKHRVLNSLEEAEEYLEECLDLGYEGIILRDPRGKYKMGKSTLRDQAMLKVKPFIDAEGRIKGWYEEERNTNVAKRDVTGKLKRSSAKAGKVKKGRLGGFILDDCETGVEVRCGGGFTERQRIELWRLIQENPESVRGELVKYQKQKVGEKDKPRHPNFVDFINFRPDWDYTE